MKRLLVHLHLFYPDQTDYFVEKLRNISGISWDLKVTFPEPHEESMKKILSIKPDAEFIKVENIGYDIWPFISLMQAAPLDCYDYVMKLHTKRSMGKCKPNIIMFNGFGWRNALVDGMLHSPAHFQRLISRFEKDPRLGMVSNLSVRVSRDYFDDAVRKELLRLGLPLKDPHTCMGSMFIMRAQALKLLSNPLISRDLFAKETPVSGKFFQTAHLYERILSHLPINSGLRYRAFSPKLNESVRIHTLKAIEPLGKFFFSCQREGPERRKVVRLCGIRLFTGQPALN